MKSSFCGDGAAGGATGDGAAGVGGGGFSGDGDMSGAAPFVASASASFGAASESTDSEASSRVFASAWDASSSVVKMFDAPQLPRGRPGEKSGKGSMSNCGSLPARRRSAQRATVTSARREITVVKTRRVGLAIRQRIGGDARDSLGSNDRAMSGGVDEPSGSRSRSTTSSSTSRQRGFNKTRNAASKVTDMTAMFECTPLSSTHISATGTCRR